MANFDSRIDGYIARSAEFARPILTHLRELVHKACPQVQETLKWSMPSFEYKGLLCGMAAFKQHATFGFWKHDLVVGRAKEKQGMGQFGKITSLTDLPEDNVLLAFIRKAVELNETGVKNPARVRKETGERPKLMVPDFLATALRRNKKAQANFTKFSYSHKKEYIEWLTGAKREETRQRRLATAMGWMAEGKSQSWKYERC